MFSGEGTDMHHLSVRAAGYCTRLGSDQREDFFLLPELEVLGSWKSTLPARTGGNYDQGWINRCQKLFAS